MPQSAKLSIVGLTQGKAQKTEGSLSRLRIFFIPWPATRSESFIIVQWKFADVTCPHEPDTTRLSFPRSEPTDNPAYGQLRFRGWLISRTPGTRTRKLAAPAVVKRIDNNRRLPLMAQLSALIDAFYDAPNIIQLFVHHLLSVCELAAVHSYNDAATGTGNLRVLFEPSDLLSELVSALRAMNRDFNVIEYHKLPNALMPNDNLSGGAKTPGV